MARQQSLEHARLAPGGEGEAARGALRDAVVRRLRFDELGILVAAVLFFAIGAFSSPYFLTLDNLTGILQSVTFLGFLSVGVALALIAGEIDISVGSVYALSAVVTALLLKHGYGVPLAIAGGLGAGLACGLVNGIVAQV